MNIKKNSVFMLSAVLGISAILYVLDSPILIPKAPTPTSLPILSPTQEAQVAQPTQSPSGKKTLSASVDYMVKRFSESIDVSLTLDTGIITDLTINHTPKEGESALYHDSFDGEIRPLVMGKNIKDINVSRVAGASDTSEAFMLAIERIRSQL